MSYKTKRREMRKKRQQMTISVLILVVGVLLVAAVALLLPKGKASPAVAPSVSGAPRLAADKEEVDLGDVKLGQWVTVSFQLTNTGDQTLRFTEEPYIEVVAGC